jgi:hypothetical protein
LLDDSMFAFLYLLQLIWLRLFNTFRLRLFGRDFFLVFSFYFDYVENFFSILFPNDLHIASLVLLDLTISVFAQVVLQVNCSLLFCLLHFLKLFSEI